ncbi:MAG: hypothetical protein LBU15_03515 [Rickettsiales bacterium]|jgi:hypothetical protein|nr:hypothetical protein [Rickettsiales bacterium]
MADANANNILNLPRDEEIFHNVVGGYLEARYGELGQEYEIDEEEKLKLEAHMAEHGVDQVVVNRLVRSSEIASLTLRKGNGLGLRLNDNLLFATRVSEKDGNGKTRLLLNEERQALLANGIGINFVFTLGVVEEDGRGVDGGHFVAIRVLQDPGTGRIFVLYRDSFGLEIGEEIRIFVERELGKNVEVMVIENQGGVMRQLIDGTTCGLRALTVMASGGLFDRVENRIGEYGGLDNFIARNLEEHLLDVSIWQPKGKEAGMDDDLFPLAVVGGYREVRLENLRARASQPGRLTRKEKREMRKLEKMQINQSSRPPEEINGSQGSRRPSLGARVFRFLSTPFRYIMSSVRSFLGKSRRNGYGPEEVAKLTKNDREDAVMVASQLVQKKSAALGLSLETAKIDEKDGQTVDGEATNLSITDYANPPERDVVEKQVRNGKFFSVILKDGNDFLGVRIFVDPATQKTTVLRRGPAGTGVDKKFRDFLSATLGKDCKDMRIVNVENNARQPENALASCLDTLASLAEGGSLAKLNATICEAKNSKEPKKALGGDEVQAAGKADEEAAQKSLEARLGAASDDLGKELGLENEGKQASTLGL